MLRKRFFSVLGLVFRMNFSSAIILKKRLMAFHQTSILENLFYADYHMN